MNIREPEYPHVLILVYRDGYATCRQYAFENVEDFEHWAKRKPYSNEGLRVLVAIDREPARMFNGVGLAAVKLVREFLVHQDVA